MIETAMSTFQAEPARRRPVSVVCVFNNPQVLRDCLQASLLAGLPAAPNTDFVPVDNTYGQFASAGAALNHGASLARHGVLVFAHQDVYLHSLAALEEAAGTLSVDPAVGLLGAVGMTASGRLLGLIRDRIVLSGERVCGLSDVDSLDEVLFMARKETIVREPLAQNQDLSWHAYAVEYGVRMRSQGRRVVVTDIPLTHNSLTINLDRLAEAHSWIAAAYPESMPVVTTCGTVTSAAPARKYPIIDGQKWRYRWLRESVTAHRLRRQTKTVTVLGDIRRDIDDVCAAAGLESATIINAIPPGLATHPIANRVELDRRRVGFSFVAAAEIDIPALLGSYPADETIAVTNISLGAVRRIAEAMSGRQSLAGFHENTGPWLLFGPAVAAAKPLYSSRRSTPFAMKPAERALAEGRRA